MFWEHFTQPQILISDPQKTWNITAGDFASFLSFLNFIVFLISHKPLIIFQLMHLHLKKKNLVFGVYSVCLRCIESVIGD